jgi:hypothetical protein
MGDYTPAPQSLPARSPPCATHRDTRPTPKPYYCSAQIRYRQTANSQVSDPHTLQTAEGVTSQVPVPNCCTAASSSRRLRPEGRATRAWPKPVPLVPAGHYPLESASVRPRPDRLSLMSLRPARRASLHAVRAPTTVLLCHAHRVSFSGTTARASSSACLVQSASMSAPSGDCPSTSGAQMSSAISAGTWPSQSDRARGRRYSPAVADGIRVGATEGAHGRGYLLPAVHRGRQP